MEEIKNGTPLTEIKDWRVLFTEKQLNYAEQIVTSGECSHFSCTDQRARAEVRINPGKGKWYLPTIKKTPQSFSDEWNVRDFTCNCNKKAGYRFLASYSEPCAHEAALLMLFEKEHGPWVFTESQEEMELRLKREYIEQEQERRRQQKEKEEGIETSVSDVFLLCEEPEEVPYFNLKKIMEGKKTSLYAYHLAENILKKGMVHFLEPELAYDSSGAQKFCAAADINDGISNVSARMQITNAEVVSSSCNCADSRYFWRQTPRYCAHQLVLLAKMWEYLGKANPGDATDLAALNFFDSLDSNDIVLDESEAVIKNTKAKKVALKPRITLESGEPKLSFKIGMSGEKGLILKKLMNFVDAVDNEETFEISKTKSIDFSQMDFTDESIPWLTFIQRRVGEMERVNDRLMSRRSYGYSPGLSVLNQEILSGSTLDRFYDIAEGKDCEYQSKAAKIDGTIHVGHANLYVELKTEQIYDDQNRFVGISVNGNMPVILKGVSDSYILDENHLSRISKEEQRALLPFEKTASHTGTIRFQVGKAKLSEFYYRVVPNLLESRYIYFEDNCSDLVQDILPPEPHFLFRLDMEEDECVCRESVTYEDTTYELPLKQAPAEGEYHDTSQEARVEKVIRKYFPEYDEQMQGYVCDEDDTQDSLYHVLTEALPELSRYGEVQGSQSFRRISVKPVPSIHVGVSLQSGLMDISVISKDIAPDELLAVLESYRRKKKYFRLKSGDFINIESDEQLEALEDMMDSMHLSTEEVIQGKVKLPAYRSLYLDKMLESHDALVADRNRTYRALVKNFRTIRDADYEPVESMQDVLRPYQMYGYKWLRTLTAVGFGGILADEMGLGKTLQMIALLAALQEDGVKMPSLIVCPASLVYNWQEEFHRFAPEVEVAVVAGTAASRKKLEKQMAEQKREGLPFVYITSYDLLRKDISQYENNMFSVMVLDEAQYIKNQRAALTKAVKIVQAEHRFALTGTPIENRLAELWSIFDFLMPGFLYSYEEFARRFEVPITKSKDEEAAGQLKQMVGPFILRRLKTEVLKDLPPKLEEVRYARFEGEQRKLYDGQVVHMKQMLSDRGNDKIQIFTELTRIRQICCDPSLLFENYKGESAKRQACMELIQNAMGGGHRMLVFSQFTSMLALLEEDLKKAGIAYYKITGATPKERRIRMVHDFNENEVPVFLISLKAGGTGLNLTGADVVIHYDPWWNVAAQNQATDRAHRIGQQNQVTVYRLIVKDTIEEKILALQEAKKDLADAILSGEQESIYTLSTEELMQLL